jgi:thioredoxin reductase (NADPH)
VELRGDDRLETVVVALADDSRLELPADLVVVSIGQVPDLSGVAGWELDVGRGPLLVSSTMETDMPGVFAVGDFATYPGKVKLIATAVAEGATAAGSIQRYLEQAARRVA